MTDDEFYVLVDLEPQDTERRFGKEGDLDPSDLTTTASWTHWLKTVYEVMPRRLSDRWHAYSHQPADIWLQSVLTSEAWLIVQKTVPIRKWRSVAYYVRDDYRTMDVGRIDAVSIAVECTLANKWGFEGHFVCPGPLSIEGRIN
ncbi:hypothetical protein ACMAZE_12050 [Pseudopelagicola sp. nBUS_20]|uniref:hypothetical protein n=1 Tax=Pseudopelagicola sp. nBUS_20 TaxID=3395317 RepID=UPI003EBF0FE1